MVAVTVNLNTWFGNPKRGADPNQGHTPGRLREHTGPKVLHGEPIHSCDRRTTPFQAPDQLAHDPPISAYMHYLPRRHLQLANNGTYALAGVETSRQAVSARRPLARGRVVLEHPLQVFVGICQLLGRLPAYDQWHQQFADSVALEVEFHGEPGAVTVIERFELALS